MRAEMAPAVEANHNHASPKWGRSFQPQRVYKATTAMRYPVHFRFLWTDITHRADVRCFMSDWDLTFVDEKDGICAFMFFPSLR